MTTLVATQAKNRGELLASWTALRQIMAPFAGGSELLENNRSGRKRPRRAV